MELSKTISKDLNSRSLSSMLMMVLMLGFLRQLIGFGVVQIRCTTHAFLCELMHNKGLSRLYEVC